MKEKAQISTSLTSRFPLLLPHIAEISASLGGPPKNVRNPRPFESQWSIIKCLYFFPRHSFLHWYPRAHFQSSPIMFMVQTTLRNMEQLTSPRSFLAFWIYTYHFHYIESITTTPFSLSVTARTSTYLLGKTFIFH